MQYALVLRHADGSETLAKLERDKLLRVKEQITVKGRTYVVTQALLGNDAANPRAWAKEVGAE